MKDKMRELLPCPFCDSNAALEHHHYFSIECSNEECGVILSNISQVKLIKAWNTRANQSELARLVLKAEHYKNGLETIKEIYLSGDRAKLDKIFSVANMVLYEAPEDIMCEQALQFPNLGVK